MDALLNMDETLLKQWVMGPMLLTVICVALAGWGVAKYLKSAKRMRAIDEKVEREMDALLSLSATEVEARVWPLLEEQALTQKWTAPPSAEVESRLAQLDPALARLLRKHRKICFQESFTEIGAELLLSQDAPDGLWLVGVCLNDQTQLGVKAHSPTIHDIADGRRRDTFPTIFHYLLVVELD